MPWSPLRLRNCGWRVVTRRRVPWVLAGLAAAILVLHTAVWLAVTSRMIDAIPKVIQAAGYEGWTVLTRDPTRAGWPLEARVHMPGATASSELAGTRIMVGLDAVDLVLRPEWRPVLRIESGRTGRIRIGDTRAVPLRADRAVARVAFDPAVPAELAIHGLEAGSPGARIAAAQVVLRVAGGVVSGSVGPVTTDPPAPPPFDLGATLAARVQASPPFPVTETPQAGAAAWQAAGGRVRVHDLVLTWGKLRVEGSGEGGLDPALQPFGAADLRVQGGVETVDGASRAGLLAPGPASAVRAVLGLLTLAAHGGPVPLPVTLRDRTLTVATYKVLRLPPIEWAR